MAEGEFALVKDHLEAAGEMPVSSRGFLMNETERYFLLADLAVLERDAIALRQYAPLAEEMARRDGHILYQASAHRAYAQAKARLNQALELFQELDTGWQIGRTLYELAELAITRADHTEARDYFTRALVAFEEIGANPDALRTRDSLRSLD